MRTLLLLLLFIPVLSWAKLVTTTYATLTNVIITYKPETGASEHTLVVPPDYPSYTQAYTCTYDEGSYTLDIEVPDDPPPEDEEVEQEDGEGDGDGDGEEDGGVTFETSVVWSVERSGAIIDGSTTTRDVTVKFLEGNTEDVVLKVEVTVECTAGNGVGTHDRCTFKIHSPVWDTYHSISMYAENATIDAPRCAAVGEDVTFTVQLPNDSEYDRRLGVDIKTYLDDLKGPNSPRWNRPDALLGEVIVGDSVTWTASDTPTTEPAEISVVIDDSPYPKPPNERGTTDDDPYPLDAIQITIVAVDSLLPDIGEEIDDGDDDPDTRTFVLAVADTGVVTVEVTPNPSVAEADLPASWSLTGGTGTGKLLRTINRAAPGIYTITCECGTSKKTTNVIVLKVELSACFKNINGIVHETVIPNNCSPHFVYTYADNFYATITPELPTLSFVLERIGISPDTADKGTVHCSNFLWNEAEHYYDGPWYASKIENSYNKCANDPIIMNQNVTFAVKLAGQILDTLDLTVLSGFNYLLLRNELKAALDMVCTKYASVIGNHQWNKIAPGDINGTSLLNNVTIESFDSENYCAGVIGHENVHCGQSSYLRWLGQGGAKPESKRLYWEAVMEIPAYQWQVDNANNLCLSQRDTCTVQYALETYIQQMYDNQ